MTLHARHGTHGPSKLAWLQAENARLKAALADAATALYNGFEPDKQSNAYKRAMAALAHGQSVEPEVKR